MSGAIEISKKTNLFIAMSETPDWYTREQGGVRSSLDYFLASHPPTQLR